MVTAYFLVVFVSITLLGVYVISSTRTYLFEQKRVQTLMQANVVSNYLVQYKELSEESITFLLQNMLQLPADSRLLITDADAKISFDSKGLLKGKYFTEKIVISALSGTSRTALGVDSSDESLVSAGVPITDEGKITGAVFLQLTAAEVDDNIGQMKTRLSLFVVICSILAALISFLMASLIAHPVQRLTKQLQSAMEEGSNYDIKISGSGSGEIGQLVDSFQKMTAQIQEQEEKRQEFVSNASHELKTPLSSIKLIADSLLQAPDAPREMVEEFLTDMNVEVDRLTRIVNKLLTLTKMDNHVSVMRMEFIVMDFGDVVSSAVRALRPLAESKGITLSYEAEDTIYSKIERDRLWEAIFNIIDNAIKYTPEGGTVDVRLSKQDNNAVLTVRDSGIGIAKNELYKIFDRFYRVDKARARDTGGTGLGLSIALSAVELHGGSIDVDSEEGTGTCFTITVPITLK